MKRSNVIPVVSSILIILAIAFLRERSKTLAAILATMPINIPLGLWVLFGTGEADPSVVALFLRALLPGLLASLVWVGVVFALVQTGMSLWLSIPLGYVAWGVLVAAFVRLEWIVVR